MSYVEKKKGNVAGAVYDAGISFTMAHNDAVSGNRVSGANNFVSGLNSLAGIPGKSNQVVTGTTAAIGLLTGTASFATDSNAENALILTQGVGNIGYLAGTNGVGIVRIAGGAAVAVHYAGNSLANTVDRAKGHIQDHHNRVNEAIDGNDSSNDPSSNSNSSDQSNNGSDNSPSEPYEPPPPPPKPTYKIEFDDGRPTTYTNNPFKDEYKGGKVSIIGFDDREYPIDPIPVDLNQPDWKKQVDEIAEKWRNGSHNKNKYYLYDPVVLDLDGDGIETIAHNKNKGAMFDFNNDGLRNATGWVKSDDGILVFDRNNNGLVDNGAEVFGDSTVKTDGTTAQHGFDALSDLDDNHDGRIDALDTHFNDLKVA